DAMPRPWHRLQPLGIDFLAAVDALPETSFADARQSLLYHLEQLALVVALAEEKLLGVRTGGAVRYVLCRVFIGRAAVRLCARHCPAQVVLPCLQPLSECLQLLLIHNLRSQF